MIYFVVERGTDMASNFFAMISRLKYIDRWALMRNTHPENLSEHCMETACIAHALAVIGNRRLGKSYNVERTALLGLYHDAPETLTGDMPTPVKYYNPDIREAYAKVEQSACEHLVSMLPDDLRGDFSPFFVRDQSDWELWRLVKAADKICAYIKCIEEKKAGNTEFDRAAEFTLKAIEELAVPEAEEFMKEFLHGYELTLDEIKE